MAKLNSYTDNSVLSDPYGVLGGTYNPNTTDTLISKGSNTHVITGSALSTSCIDIPEHSTVRIGDDFSMSCKEFKICMQMLRKMAMEQMPEVFI